MGQFYLFIKERAYPYQGLFLKAHALFNFVQLQIINGINIGTTNFYIANKIIKNSFYLYQFLIKIIFKKSKWAFKT